MKKAIILALSLITIETQTITKQEALHNLTERTRSLRNIKNINSIYWLVTTPLIVLGSACSKEPEKAAVAGLMLAITGNAGISITQWIRGINARWYFRYLYNKKANSSGYMVDGFSNGEFILDDQMFVALGLKAGFHESELIDLAKKSGRTALAQQLAATEYYA